MYQSNRAIFDALRSFNTATFTGSYQAFGTALGYPARILHFINKSNVDATISTDGGTSDNIFIPAGSFALYDLGTNRGTSADALEFAKGTGLMMKGSAGVGLVYLMVIAAFTPTQSTQ